MENNQVLCQSCGISLEAGYYGTNQDSTISGEFCKYCYDMGQFREPNLTLEEMIGRFSAKQIDENHMAQQEALSSAQSTIPKLKRWRNI